MQIKIFNSNKKLNKFLLKTILKETKLDNNLSLGIGYENGILPFFPIISNFKKIKWNNIKIISLIEYFDHQSTMFYTLLQRDFISKLNGFDNYNFFNKIDDIKTLKKLNNLNFLYDKQIDLGIFFLDFRGNFLLNDYESKCNFIHISTNGDKIISPGLKSIFSFFKIIIIANDTSSQTVLDKLVSKEIDEDEPFTFLNFHKNSILLTLSSLVSKKKIAKSVNSIDIEKWTKKIFKDNQNFDTNSNLNIISGDKYIDDNLDQIALNSEKSLDKELEDALKIIDEEKDAIPIILDETDNDNKINIAYDSENLYDEIVDNSLLDNLNQNYSSKENNFDLDLYGNNVDDKNLFDSDYLSNNKSEENEFISDSKFLYESDIRKNLDDDTPIVDNNYYSTDFEKSILLDEKNSENIMLEPIELKSDVDLKLDKSLNDTFDFDIKEKFDFSIKKILKSNDYLFRKEDIRIIESKIPIIQKDYDFKKNNMDEINYLQRVIKIKEDTLKIIESLQNLHLVKDAKEDMMQFRYIPGIRPTPMLAIYDTPNFDVFANIRNLMNQEIKVVNYESDFIDNFKHFWNHGAYIIFDESSLEIKSLVFSDFSNFIFLLRSINKALWFYVKESMRLIFEKESKIFMDEFLLI